MRYEPICAVCTDTFKVERYQAGYRLCMPCGEESAKLRKHTVVPMPKSNYILVTDLTLLKGLNSSHKGHLS